MNTYIASRPVAGAADAAEQFAQGFDAARTEAEENNLALPSPAVGSLLSTLAAATTSAHGAVAVTPRRAWWGSTFCAAYRKRPR